MMKYPAMDYRCNGEDIIINEDGNDISTVSDYWKWAHTNIMDNAERGVFAEYLVSKAVKSKSVVRENWAKYDVVSEEGITIEVKTSAYLQTWGQNDLSSVRFGVAKTQGYDIETNSYEQEKKRQAQVYVFCLYAEKEQDNINVLDMAQWEFYVLKAQAINESIKYKDYKSLGLNAIVELGAKKCSYEKIHQTIKEIL